MNHLKNPPPSSVIPHLILVISFGIIALGGVRHAMIKNHQVKTDREIDALGGLVEEHRLDIGILKMRNERLLEQFAISERLKTAGTNLRPIPAGFAEKFSSTTPPTAVAATLP
jgi:hypothetical protein